MYRTLENEIYHKRIKKSDIADYLGITQSTLSLKLSGRFQFTLEEAIKIKRFIRSDLSIEELFERAAA